MRGKTSQPETLPGEGDRDASQAASVSVTTEERVATVTMGVLQSPRAGYSDQGGGLERVGGQAAETKTTMADHAMAEPSPPAIPSWTLWLGTRHHRTLRHGRPRRLSDGSRLPRGQATSLPSPTSGGRERVITS